jgi:hypothetical protein
VGEFVWKNYSFLSPLLYHLVMLRMLLESDLFSPFVHIIGVGILSYYLCMCTTCKCICRFVLLALCTIRFRFNILPIRLYAYTEWCLFIFIIEIAGNVFVCVCNELCGAV